MPLDTYITNLFEHSYEHWFCHRHHLKWRVTTLVIRTLFLLLTGCTQGYTTRWWRRSAWALLRPRGAGCPLPRGSGRPLPPSTPARAAPKRCPPTRLLPAALVSGRGGPCGPVAEGRQQEATPCLAAHTQVQPVGGRRARDQARPPHPVQVDGRDALPQPAAQAAHLAIEALGAPLLLLEVRAPRCRVVATRYRLARLRSRSVGPASLTCPRTDRASLLTCLLTT